MDAGWESDETELPVGQATQRSPGSLINVVCSTQLTKHTRCLANVTVLCPSAYAKPSCVNIAADKQNFGVYLATGATVKSGTSKNGKASAVSTTQYCFKLTNNAMRGLNNQPCNPAESPCCDSSGGIKLLNLLLAAGVFHWLLRLVAQNADYRLLPVCVSRCWLFEVHVY